MFKFVKGWVGKDLPQVHVKTDQGLKKIVYDLLFHPIKRRIAKYYVYVLQRFFGLIVIGITGSAGKTTTKEMIVSVLKKDNSIVWSKDNIDPIFNIPTTILRCTPKTKYLVVEMGVEYPMEMNFYLWLVKPKIGVITNIYPTHTLFFKNVDGVFTEKQKLSQASEIAVLNKDDKYCFSLRNKYLSKIVWFKSDDNPIQANKNAANEVCKLLGVDDELIKKGLMDYESPRHRLNLIKHKSGAYIFDDTYNSNPKAFLKSITYFSKIAGHNNKIAVIGDMLELGDIEVVEHKKIAKLLKQLSFNEVYGVGKLVHFFTKNVYERPDDLTGELKKYLKKGNYIFIKGSRSIGLDKLVDKLII